MTTPLALIAARSPDAARTATDALRAQQNGSPMAAARAARAARLALSDPVATFSADERRQIAEMLDTERDVDIRLRVTLDEKERVQAMADALGLTVSAFVRQRIGL
jgi:L-serine deaminase